MLLNLWSFSHNFCLLLLNFTRVRCASVGPLISLLTFKPALCERLEACHWSRGGTSSPDPVVKYDSAPQRTRARARQAGARGSVMRSLRGELPRMPRSTALCSYESWHACNRGNATSGRGLIEVYVTLIGLYFECFASGPHRLKYSIRRVSRGDFWDDVVLVFACFAWFGYWLMFRRTSFIGRCASDSKQNIYKCKFWGDIKWWIHQINLTDWLLHKNWIQSVLMLHIWMYNAS